MNLEKMNVFTYIWGRKIHACDTENRIGKGWTNLGMHRGGGGVLAGRAI